MKHAPEGSNPLANDLLHSVFLIMRRAKREGMHNSPVSYADLMILSNLRRSPCRGVSDLAAEAGVSGPTMSGQIKRLEEAGMILREPGPDSDRRRVSLMLSPKADAIIDSVKRQGADWMSNRLAELSPADQDILARAMPALMAIAGNAPAREDCL